MTAPPTGAMRPADAAALARIAGRLDHAPTPPWLHGEVARRMAERLPLIRQRPRSIVDWHAHAGGGGVWLAQAYPQARIVAVERAAARRAGRTNDAATGGSRWWPPARWRRAPAPPVVDDDAVATGAAELVWANMALQWAADPGALMRRWHAALAVDGFLMCSTLGPGSLAELRALYAAEGWRAPMAPLVDMHDLGDLLIDAGFAGPVMDQETLTLTYASPQALLDELRDIGGNAHPMRHAGLRTPRWRARLLARLAALAQADGRIGLTFEVVYGHAFKPLPRPKVAPRTTVALDEMRALVRARRPER